MKSIFIALSLLVGLVATAQAQEITQQPTRYKPTVEAAAPAGPSQRYVTPANGMSKGQSHRYSSAKATKSSPKFASNLRSTDSPPSPKEI